MLEVAVSHKMEIEDHGIKQNFTWKVSDVGR